MIPTLNSAPMRFLRSLLFVISLVVFSCQEGATERKESLDQLAIAAQNKELLRQVYTEVFVDWNRERVEEVLAPNFRSHDWPADSRTGVDGFYDFYDPVLASFPDTRYVVHELIAEGDKVTVYWTLKGTHKGAFLGLPPTNREIAMDGIAIYRVENDLLKERWVVYDFYAMVEQVRAGVQAMRSAD